MTKNLLKVSLAMVALAASITVNAAEQTTVNYTVDQAEAVDVLTGTLKVDGYDAVTVQTMKFGEFTFKFSATRAGNNYSVLMPVDVTPSYLRIRVNTTQLTSNVVTINVTAPEGKKINKIAFKASNEPKYNIAGESVSAGEIVAESVTDFYWQKEADQDGVNDLTFTLTGDVKNYYVIFNLSQVAITYEDIPTGVEAVEMESEAEIYNISGVRMPSTSLENLPAGLYIVNGKKVVK